MPSAMRTSKFTALGGDVEEISRESAAKFRAGHMSPSSLPPELQLNSTPWAEALIGGQAVVGATGHPQEAPGTDEQRPAIPVCR